MKKILVLLTLLSCTAFADTVRIATFNVSMEADNYKSEGEELDPDALFKHLATGEHPQIRNIAEIIQRVRPDILLLNEFDYTPDQSRGIDAFQRNYLSKSQQGQAPIEYPFVYSAPVNTGVDSGFDLNGDGKASGSGADAFGFGLYPGQYAMVLLSRYPLQHDKARTFQHFLWKDMPQNSLSKIKTPQGHSWYSDEAIKVLRLSSKSHWDIPVAIGDKTLHVLASHPTPPVFDGPEDRNGHRNHDENRFWADYLQQDSGSYIYDDSGATGGLEGQYFVVMGDLNASPDEGNARIEGIRSLVFHPKMAKDVTPISKGGKHHSPDNPHGASHTAAWRMRADYVLPSETLKIKGSGVFWPEAGSELERLVKDRSASSDHRLVWVDVAL